MKGRVVLVGAGGHAISVINLLSLNGVEIRCVYDDNYHEGEKIGEYPLAGKLSSISPEDCLVLSVGENKRREALFSGYRKQIFSTNLFHPTSLIEREVSFGAANLVFAMAYLNSNVSVGDNNILNTSSVLEHEVSIGSHNHVAVNAVLCGRVQVGSRCFIGAGAVVRDKVKISDNVVVGANSTVIEDIDMPGTYVGSPARKTA